MSRVSSEASGSVVSMAPFNEAAADLDFLINRHLNTALDLSQRDIVVRMMLAYKDTSNDVLKKQIRPETITRMLRVMSDHAAECSGLGYPLDESDRETGFKLVQLARASSSFMRHLLDCDDLMLEKMKNWGFPKGVDLNTPVTKKKLQEIADQYARDFADVYGMHKPLRIEVTDDPEFLFGGTQTELEDGSSLLHLKAIHYRSFADLPTFILFLAHESGHAYLKALGKGLADAPFDQDGNMQLTLRGLTDRAFYSTDRPDVYQNHFEESLVESIGIVHSAMFIRDILGYRVPPQLYEQSLAVYSHAVVKDTVARVTAPQPPQAKV